MNKNIYDIAVAMMAAAWREDISINAENHVIYRLTRELGIAESEAKEYAERAADDYTQAYTNSGPSRNWPSFDKANTSEEIAAVERSRQNAIERLINMRLDDPVRASFVKLIGYDPNDKWSQPIGNFETSQAMSKMIKQKNLKPDLDF